MAGTRSSGFCKINSLVNNLVKNKKTFKMSGYNLLYNVSTRGFGGLKNLQLKKKKSAKLSGP